MTHPSHLKNELSMILALRNGDEEVFDDSLRVFVSKVEMMLESSPKCNCCKQSSSSESRSFKLQFLDKISTLIFTGDKIKGEGCASLKVALYDCLTGAVVDSGREANANIELVVLKGDNSTVEDFEQKIVKEMKGKKSLLKGKTMLKLKEGCCDMGDISFIHNSDWVKVCQLSLAVRVVDNFPGTTIEPAMTENFTLKDCRTRLPNKKYPPALSDEIWRLEKIGKKGANHDRLKEKNIRSVEDFLKLLVMEPERLKMILSIGAKTWKVMTEHANTCLIDESLQFCYYPNAEQKNGVIFNVVGKLKGLLRESQYVPVGELSDVEKANAHKLVMCAFKNGEKLTPYNDENSFLKTCPPFSGPLRLENPNECIHEPQVNLNSHDYAQPGASPYANIPSISCAGESSTPDHGQFHYDASVDHFEECVRFPGQSFDYPINSPENAHHHLDEGMLQRIYSISNHQSKNPSVSQGEHSSSANFLLDSQDVPAIDVRKIWRRVLIIVYTIVTVKSIGSTGKLPVRKKPKLSDWCINEF